MKLLLPLLFLFNFFSPNLFAEHREPSVLPTARAFDDLQIVRENGALYRKELLKDGLRLNLFESASKSHASSWTFTDFVSKKSCGEDNEARLLIAFTKDNSSKAKQACEDILEGKMESQDSATQTLRCRYSCKSLSLEALQSAYFESYVRYLEPNVSRGLN